MPVDPWFLRFGRRLQERMPRPDWPEQGSEFWQALQRALVRHGVTEGVADAACDLLVEDPPFPDQLVKRLLACVKQVWASSEVAPSGPDSREATELASKDCPDCRGSGLTVRWRQRSATPDHRSIVLYCTCPLGRWIEKANREKSPEVRKRMHDLNDYPFLQAPEYRMPPGVDLSMARRIEREELEAIGAMDEAPF